MAEILMTPSLKVFTWDKVDLTKEALAKSLEDIKKMTPAEVKTNLEKYTSINFNTKDVNSKTNTLEMTALYQRSLNILWYKTDIDARFGPTTRTNLKSAQEQKLNIKGKDADGLPGPTTTAALITALGKNDTSIEVIIEDTPIKKAKKLLSQNWYIEQPDWIYRNTISNTILQIDGNKIISKSNPRLSTDDQEKKLALMSRLETLLNSK